MHSLPKSSTAAQSRLMTYAVIVSLFVHAIPIFGLRFTPPDPRTLFNRAQLDVVLVNARSKTAPTKADVLAQEDLDGGGNTDAPNHRISTPLPAETTTQIVSDQLVQQSRRQQELEARQQKLMSALKSGPTLPPDEAKPKPSTQEVGVSAEDLQQQAREIARMEGEISRDLHAYQTRPRKAFVAGRARSDAAARYLDDWRSKIERIGNMNFPRDAQGNRLYGTLQVTVEIRSDGSLEKVEIDRSSGKPELDEAARAIVKRAAAFAPLPTGILDASGRPADILSITRAWTFSPGVNALNSPSR